MKRQTKAERLAQAKKDHEAFLLRMGYRGPPKESVHQIPRFKTDDLKHTSKTLPGSGAKIRKNTYTGSEIAGIALNHKQNYEPIRKDNKQAAIDSAQMRRN